MTIYKRLGTLTSKPMLYIFNRESVNDDIADIDEMLQKIKSLSDDYMFLDAFSEWFIQDADTDERENMRQEMGVSNDGVDELVNRSLKLLNLITFFTTGEMETRGWLVSNGSTIKESRVGNTYRLH